MYLVLLVCVKQRKGEKHPSRQRKRRRRRRSRREVGEEGRGPREPLATKTRRRRRTFLGVKVNVLFVSTASTSSFEEEVQSLNCSRYLFPCFSEGLVSLCFSFSSLQHHQVLQFVLKENHTSTSKSGVQLNIYFEQEFLFHETQKDAESLLNSKEHLGKGVVSVFPVETCYSSSIS